MNLHNDVILAGAAAGHSYLEHDTHELEPPMAAGAIEDEQTRAKWRRK